MTFADLQQQLAALAPHVNGDANIAVECWISLAYSTSCDVVSVRYDTAKHTITLVAYKNEHTTRDRSTSGGAD